MDTKTTEELEQELADLRIQLEQKQQAIEAQKQAEIAQQQAEREQGIRDAWQQLTSALVEADMIAPAGYEHIETERGRKIAETKFNKRSVEIISEILGVVPATAGRDLETTNGRKNKRLSDEQKSKIEEWFQAGLTVAQMNKQLTTNPTPASYQRIHNFVKKLKNTAS